MDGRRCRLEPLDPDRHAEALHAANSLDRDGGSFTYLPYGPFPDLGVYRAWMAECCASEDPLFFAIVDAAKSRAVGVASYLRIAPSSGSMEVGNLHFSPR